MAALDHPWNDIVAPVTDGDLEHQEDLCRCEHRRPLPADQVEDSRPQPPSDTVQRGSWKVYHWRVVRSVARVPLPAFPISTTATTAPSRTRTLLGLRSAWTMSGDSRGGGTSAHTSRRRSTKADTTEEYPESRPRTGGETTAHGVSLRSSPATADS